MKHTFKFIFLFFFLFSQSILSQSKEDLEIKKQVLKSEIQNIETLIKRSISLKDVRLIINGSLGKKDISFQEY